MTTWLISANPNMYNHSAAFDKWGYIDWFRFASFQVGDIIYIYASKQDGRIRYKTVVEIASMSFKDKTDDTMFWYDSHDLQRNDRRFSRLRLLDRFDGDGLDLNSLRLHGLSNAPQGAKKLSGDLLEYIQSQESRYSLATDVLNFEQKEIIREIETINDEISSLNLQGEYREAIVKQRINQDAFRRLLLSKYNSCCLCRVNDPNLLLASHIKPWAVSNKFEKVDINNGLLLCPNHDKLFDRGCISFDSKGMILVSDKLSETNRIYMNVNEDMNIDMTSEMNNYMNYHREFVFDSKNGALKEE